MALADDTLQRYFDGDLPEAEADVVRKALEESPADRARLHVLERTRTLIRVGADESARDLDSDALFAKVRTGISDVSASRANGAVRSMEEARERKKKSAWLPAAALVAIAAAAVLAIVAQQKDSATITVAYEETQPLPSVATARPAAPSATTHQGSSVVEVDFGSNTGTVFEVEGATGEPLAVVWINDEAIDPTGQVMQ